LLQDRRVVGHVNHVHRQVCWFQVRVVKHLDGGVSVVGVDAGVALLVTLTTISWHVLLRHFNSRIV
jgi:hypothetical protein